MAKREGRKMNFFDGIDLTYKNLDDAFINPAIPEAEKRAKFELFFSDYWPTQSEYDRLVEKHLDDVVKEREPFYQINRNIKMVIDSAMKKKEVKGEQNICVSLGVVDQEKCVSLYIVEIKPMKIYMQYFISIM